MTNTNKPYKLLIVDDSLLLQTRLKKAINEADISIDIRQAFNCAEAIQLFSDFVPDKVILDIALPDGSGLELLRRFKKEKPEVVQVIFTNYPIDEFKRICFKMGSNYFIDKSDLNSLLNTFKK